MSEGKLMTEGSKGEPGSEPVRREVPPEEKEEGPGWEASPIRPRGQRVYHHLGKWHDRRGRPTRDPLMGRG